MTDNDVKLPLDGGGAPSHITNIAELRDHLQAAIELEHATIPPYLCALYSIRSGTNIEAAEIIRTVVVQEMLHMVLVANIMSALGVTPTIASPEFIPSYPAKLPIGKNGPLEVKLQKFSREAIDTFVAIEAPVMPPPEHRGFVEDLRQPVLVPPGQLKNMIMEGRLYASIGEFYRAIEAGLRALEGQAQSQQQSIFTPCRPQVGPENYYDAGGRILVVDDLRSALNALDVIIIQGEGRSEGTTELGISATRPSSNEAAHYFRFREIQNGRMYNPGDTEDRPTGREFTVDYGDDAVFDMVDNPTIERLGGGDLAPAALTFAHTYTQLLHLLQSAFSGEPDKLDTAIVQMFTLKEAALDLLNNPAPNDPPRRAGPCFEFMPTAEAHGMATL